MSGRLTAAVANRMPGSIGMATIVKIVSRHWKGEYPLIVGVLGLGVFQVLFARVVQYALVFLLEQHFDDDTAAYLRLIAHLVYNAVVITIFVWWAVGGLRSVRRSLQKKTTQVWAILAAIAIMAAVLSELFVLRSKSLPELYDAVTDVADDPEWGPHWVTIKSKYEIDIHGGLTRSLAHEFARLVRAYPRATTVVLESPGGRVTAALQMKSIIERGQLDTVVDNRCESACIVVFLGGQQREIVRGAKLGFHAATYAGEIDEAETRQLAEEVASVGASRKFLEKAYFSGDRISQWYPTINELIESGVVTDVVEKDDWAKYRTRALALP